MNNKRSLSENKAPTLALYIIIIIYNTYKDICESQWHISAFSSAIRSINVIHNFFIIPVLLIETACHLVFQL